MRVEVKYSYYSYLLDVSYAITYIFRSDHLLQNLNVEHGNWVTLITNNDCFISNVCNGSFVS